MTAAPEGQVAATAACLRALARAGINPHLPAATEWAEEMARALRLYCGSLADGLHDRDEMTLPLTVHGEFTPRIVAALNFRYGNTALSECAYRQLAAELLPLANAGSWAVNGARLEAQGPELQLRRTEPRPSEALLPPAPTNWAKATLARPPTPRPPRDQ